MLLSKRAYDWVQRGGVLIVLYWRLVQRSMGRRRILRRVASLLALVVLIPTAWRLKLILAWVWRKVSWLWHRDDLLLNE